MMRASSRRELNKLRELAHFMFAGAGATKHMLVDGDPPRIGALLCCFCKKPLAAYSDFTAHGNSTGPKLDVQITIHHVDGNHDNNDEMNKALCHTKCHKSHHRRIANLERSKEKTV